MFNLNAKTFLLLSLSVLLTGSALAAPAKKKIRLAPGAACYVWNKNVVVKPDEIPAGAFVDNATGFNQHNIKECSEVQALRDNAIFIMWEGYLRVKKEGSYRFTVNTNRDQNCRA